MHLIFVYGSLKQGFANEHINTGQRVEGAYRTLQPHPLFLLGPGDVPCLVLSPGKGYQVIGELYRVAAEGMQLMDRLERIGEPEGYERVSIELQRFDTEPPQRIDALVYVKREQSIAADVHRIGPLAEYKQEHAVNFHWKGAA
jgi:gamma-glutamylaminecyclotransferase